MLVLCDENVPQQRILITYDRDFGTLIVRDGIRPIPIVLYVRTADLPSGDAEQILAAMQYVEAGYFHVVDGDQLRKRRIDFTAE
ncbi:MAG: hypothetical protein JO036_19650 [Candidatus Eremiobacteraeota bacterium]|nr:hypothetical protein [Candidatus Eremiobacteraeota bacterium]